MAASVRTLADGFLKKILLVVADGLTKESCIALYLYAKEVRRLYTKSGPLFTALYLKQCSSSLQMAYGGDKRPPERLAVPVSLSRSGFPRIIPSFVRHKMYKRDDTADILVKCWLSLFSLARIILVAKRVGWMPPLLLP